MEPSSAFEIPEARWHNVSENLIKIRWITASIWLGIFLVASLILAIVLTRWIWIPFGVFAALTVWVMWLIPRQVRAMQYAELSDELAIRKGIVFREMTLIPYGRMQYVDVNAGPLARKFGVAEVTLKTASTETNASIPGLPAAEAARMRDQLTARGEAQLAGL